MKTLIHYKLYTYNKRLVVYEGPQFWPRDAIRNRGLCRHAVSVRPFVCLFVTFVNSVKTSKHIFNISPLGSLTILVFPYQTSWQYSDGNSLTGSSNAVV